MADTTFVARLTNIAASWLNQINRFVYGTATAAGIRNLDSSIYTRTKTYGYYGFGSKGRGEYYADFTDTTSADNGGTVFISAIDGVRWKLAIDQNPTADQFGVATTNPNNSPAVNNYLAYVGSIVGNTTAGSGSLVQGAAVFSPGIYECDTTLHATEGVRWMGESKSSTIFHIGASPLIQMGDTSTVNGTAYKANITLENFGAYPKTSSTANVGILAINCIRGCSIHDVQIWECGTTVKLSNNASWALSIYDNFFHDCLVQHIYGEQTNTLLIHNNRMDTSAGHGIVIDGQNSTVPQLIIGITNNIIQGCQLDGIRLIDCTSWYCHDNDMEQNGLAGAGNQTGDIHALQGTQAVTGLNGVVKRGYYSSGASNNSTHRAVWVDHITSFHAEDLQTAGGAVNYDYGVLLGSSVTQAKIEGNTFNGCTTPVGFTAGATKLNWWDEFGRFILGDSHAASSGTILDVQGASGNQNLTLLNNTSATAGSVVLALKTGTTGSNGYGLTLMDGASTLNARMLANGNWQNVGNSYGVLSDESLKTNIVPAKSQLADVLALADAVVNYELLSQPGTKLIGWVAQTVQKTSPGLVYSVEGLLGLHASVINVKLVKAFGEYVAQTEARLGKLEKDHSPT